MEKIIEIIRKNPIYQRYRQLWNESHREESYLIFNFDEYSNMEEYFNRLQASLDAWEKGYTLEEYIKNEYDKIETLEKVKWQNKMHYYEAVKEIGNKIKSWNKEE